MATLLEDMSTENKIRWYQKHLIDNETGEFKSGLRWERIMILLNPLTTAKEMGLV